MTSADSLDQHLVLRRVERQHALIERLRSAGGDGVSAHQLAVELRVSARTVERDLARLRHSGVPISVRRGPGGGYSFDAPAASCRLELTSAEAAGLIASLVALGPTATDSARSAMAKLVDALRA